jgi:hypothetical protein
MGMERKRGILFSAQRLLGEGIEKILVSAEGLEICGHWPIDQHVTERCSGASPDFVIFAGQGEAQPDLSHRMAEILDQYPDLPVFLVTLDRNQIQVFSSHILPARSADLIDLIQKCKVRENR